MEPTVFGKVRNDMRIAQEEVLGPVVCLIPFADEDEAIAIGNASMYGLAAGVWTRDIARAHRVCARLRTGTVWINTYRRTSYAVPFGGVRQSGLGRENGAAAGSVQSACVSAAKRAAASLTRSDRMGYSPTV
jgi:(Z)-2-((N-methylformamido)methylene)-5-hydroxybutyrolactone dehydrogenase